MILFARNIKSAEQTYTLLRECQKHVATPLFTCIDLEGGTVDRFRNVIGPAPSAAEVFATGSRALFRKHGRIIGENCRALGFNLDFAPVLDLAFEASRAVMSSRAVSDDPKQVVAYAREFLRGLADAGVLGCGKHFPGLGEATLDTHHELPSVNKPLRKLWEQDLVPYRALSLRRELPMVMVSHAAFPAVTKDRTPASLSKKWITDILRKKIGYRRLICSDDLEMGGVLAAAPTEQAIEQVTIAHVRAGGDLALICHQEDFILRAHEALLREVERDPQVRPPRAGIGAPRARLQKEIIGETPHPRADIRTSGEADASTLGIWRRNPHGYPLSRRQSAGASMSMIVAGVMSGTSADGINVALVQFATARAGRAKGPSPHKSPHSNFTLLAHEEYPFPARFAAPF